MNNVFKLILTVGVSGSGKTTWANKIVAENPNEWVIIARNEARRVLFPEFEAHEYKHTKAREKQVTKYCEDEFNKAFAGGKNVIVADTNLNPKYREVWKKRAEQAGYVMNYQDFPMSFDDIVKRNQHRGSTSVPMKVLYNQWKSWCDYVGRKTYVSDESKRKAIIVDIDGTIAIKGNRSPYDWSKVGLDQPRKPIIQLIQQFATLNKAVILFVSGRDGVCYEETHQWLTENTYFTGGLGDRLIMRSAGDQRKDSIVKEEIFWDNIADHYNVLAVFDDRPQVVEMWYDIGIENVICVADQRNRF